jgi:DNA-binding NarL/FixJ family response regulator
MNLLKIAVCLCNYLFGEGIRLLLEDGFDPGSAVVCSDPQEVIEMKPHLLITDFRMFSRMPLDSLFKEKVKILLLGTECMPSLAEEYLVDLIPKGLSGIVSAATDSRNFKRAVETVISGELWLGRKKLRDVIYQINSAQTTRAPSLTAREIEIVKLICSGHRNKEIMLRLRVSEQSVKSHLNRIYKKLGVIDRLQLAIYAAKHWPEYMRENENKNPLNTININSEPADLALNETKVPFFYKP